MLLFVTRPPQTHLLKCVRLIARMVVVGLCRCEVLGQSCDRSYFAVCRLRGPAPKQGRVSGFSRDFSSVAPCASRQERPPFCGLMYCHVLCMPLQDFYGFCQLQTVPQGPLHICIVRHVYTVLSHTCSPATCSPQSLRHHGQESWYAEPAFRPDRSIKRLWPYFALLTDGLPKLWILFLTTVLLS